MCGVRPGDNFTDPFLGIREIIVFDFREGQADNRILSCQLPHFFILPDRHVAEQFLLVVVQIGKEPFHHTEIQSFSETAGPGDEGNFILAFPPFTYKVGFVNVETVFFRDCFEILRTDTDGTGHVDPLLKCVLSLCLFHLTFPLLYTVKANSKSQNEESK